MNKNIITLTTALAVILVLVSCGKRGERKSDASPAGNSALQVQAPDGAYTVDNVHSMVVFKIKHLGLGYVYGRFNGIGGYVLLDEKNPAQSRILLKIDINSVDTNVKKRDDHLRSPDFFDARKFPIATFTSTSVSSLGNNRYRVKGNLQLHGVKKEITTTARKIGEVEKDPFGLKRAGGETTLIIKRSDYGINAIDKKMTGLVGDEAHLFISIEGIR